ncbi:MAG: hypothetical protein COV98_03245 [Candidatus Altarchaeum sp. CG12_big_fil_rev_8_21_14_0_65_33_22]|nr:MAG: hypothetical protein AUK59_02400 [Candidatus Altarchaeum sp. CG2_30_32_3053]PIN67362.1 MAG: hypothetical protein COV98_03245 [Candidatus Altarchaeum sp. CG12_big_fil_rev_8_21_14_0_65_33_22]
MRTRIQIIIRATILKSLKKTKEIYVEIDIEKLIIIILACILSAITVNIYYGINAGILFGICSMLFCILGYVFYCYLNVGLGCCSVKDDDMKILHLSKFLTKIKMLSVK